MTDQRPLKIVGQPVERADAHAKVTGRARYTVDAARAGMLHARVLRSSRAHARILSVDTSAAEDLPGVRAVVTGPQLAAWVPMPVYGYFIKDQPILAMDRVRYEGDMIAAVAAETEAQAAAALEAIRVEYEDLPVVADMDSALSDAAPALFEDPPMGIVPPYGAGASAELRPRKNVCYAFRYQTGAPDVFAGCDHVFEDEFRFSRMQHMHLEPFVCLADWREGDEVEVTTSCQNPFPLRKELSRIFRLPENRISVKVPFVGGGFGAKNNCKTEPIAMVLSKMTGAPVRFCMTMEEGFLTNTQHAAVMRLKTGVMKDGTLVARQSHVLLDAGAYSDASPLVSEKAGYRVSGPYRYAHVDSLCECVLTNTAPAGPYRGFGGTQVTWASESQIDMIAHRLGLDPMAMRLKNLVGLKEAWMPGESGVDSDMAEGLALVAEAVGYGRDEPAAAPHLARGKAVAIGFKDGGGVNKPAQARVKVSTGGDIHLMCGTVEIGQGAKTALSQVVAEILGAPLAKVEYLPLDTRYTPFDQGTNASSAITVMGQAVQRAAVSVRDQVLAMAAEFLDVPQAELRLEDWCIRQGNQSHPLAPMVMQIYGGTGFEFTGDGFHKQANDHHAPLETKSVFWEIGWAGVDLSVDRETGQVFIHKLAVSGDAGRAIHKLVCRGQDEGAAVMGLGQALFEQMIYDGPRLINSDALMYRVPLAEDLPGEFISILQEQGHGPGPFGAKGMGEGTMLPMAPVIANAIQNALGARVTALPITPERVLDAILSQG